MRRSRGWLCLPLVAVALTFGLWARLACAEPQVKQSDQSGNQLPSNNKNQNEYPSHVEIHIGNSAPPQGGAARKEPTQILRENRGSIGVLVAGGQPLPKMGTGFFVQSTGLMLTNFHVIAGAEHVGVKLPTDGAIYTANKVKGYDLKNDLVILEVETGAVKPLTLGNSDEAYVGEPIIVISNPGGLEQTVSNGLLSGIRDFNGRKLFQISAPISQGRQRRSRVQRARGGNRRGDGLPPFRSEPQFRNPD